MTGESNDGRTTPRGWFASPQGNPSDAVRARLRQGDPAEGDAGLTPEEASAMRRVVVSSTAERPVIGFGPLTLFGFGLWRATAVGALGTAAVAVGVLLQNGNDLRWLRPGGQLPGEPKATQTTPGRPDEARQIQFSTPGGTRIIWLLDPAFKL